MCVEDPQDFLIFLGLEEICIAKWATRNRSFSQNQHPRVIRRKNIKASETHTAITYSIGRCLMAIPTYIESERHWAYGTNPQACCRNLEQVPPRTWEIRQNIKNHCCLSKTVLHLARDPLPCLFVFLGFAGTLACDFSRQH